MSKKRNSNGHRRRESAKSVGHHNPIRVRGRRLDQVNEDKLTLAYWLLAKQLVEEKKDLSGLTEDAVRKVADELDDAPADDAPRPELGADRG